MISDTIKRLALEAGETIKQMQIQTGIVIERDIEKYPHAPDDITLILKVEDKIMLDVDFIIFSETSAYFSYEKGDRYFLLREQGGQRYFVLDKMYKKEEAEE